MPRALTAIYVGGPLDRQHAVKTPRQRWTIYRDDAGKPISTPKGDREFCGGLLPRRRFYLSQTLGEGEFYVHATVWEAWYADRLGMAAAY